MNQIELQLAALSVCEPSRELDERIATTLDSCPAELPAGDKPMSIRFPAVATIAAACLLTGALVGYAGAELVFPESSTADIRQRDAAGALASVDPGRAAEIRDLSALLTAHLVDARFDECQRCHLAPDEALRQLRELRQNARQQAVIWEQQTGEKFLLAAHFKDNRFTECRQCHAADGQIKAM